MLTALNPKKAVEPLLTFLMCDVHFVYLKNIVQVPFWFWAFVCKQFTLCMVYYFYFLSVFVSVGMLFIGGRDSRRPMVPITFLWVVSFSDV